VIDFIARPLASILSLFYDFIPSLGAAIILLTLLINTILFPLVLKQTRASRAFTALQPQIKTLQAKYKDDPKMMQQEMAALQRESGATPLGCLGPMIVQMPIWFALFRMLQKPLDFVPVDTGLHDAIAAGDTSFLGMDLMSTASTAWQTGFVAVLPYAIAIMLMIAAQYFQQVHSQMGIQQDTSAQAQTMQKITKAMPVFFGFIAIQFQAGVIMYWATSNLFRLAQQALIFKIDGRPHRPALGAEDEDAPSKDPEVSPSPKKPQGSAKKRNRRRRS
jgi:YidC/Oxa1 family membrane protein insertase